MIKPKKLSFGYKICLAITLLFIHLQISSANQNIRFQNAALRWDPDCEVNPLGFQYKTIAQVGAFSKEITEPLSAMGSLGNTAGLGGNATLVGYGNIALSCAHCILDNEKGGLGFGLQEPVYFYSNDFSVKAEIDLDKSKFGCRDSWKSPAVFDENNTGKKIACDWAVLVLKEDLNKKSRNKFKPINANLDVTHEKWKEKYNDLILYSIKKNREYVDSSFGFFSETNCPMNERVLGARVPGLSEYEPIFCDAFPGDSGSPLVIKDDENGQFNYMGQIPVESTRFNENYARPFTGKFLESYKQVFESEKARRRASFNSI